MNTELWIPRTSWEKRRQLGAVIHRGLAVGLRLLVLSCADWPTFAARIDVVESAVYGFENGNIEHIRVSTLVDSYPGTVNGTDLSRVLGQIGRRTGHQPQIDKVIVDDVDLLLDLGSEESATASMFALMYALRSRFGDIVLFTNPLRSEQEIAYFSMMQDFLRVHLPPQQNVA